MKTFQTVTIDGKDIVVNGSFNLQNAITAYSFFQQLSGMRVLSEYEGDVNLQLDILQSNNPNSFGLILMLRHLYNQFEPTLSLMENNSFAYLLNNN